MRGPRQTRRGSWLGLNAAKVIGLTIPESFLLRADDDGFAAG
jgi:hypothetical protein